MKGGDFFDLKELATLRGYGYSGGKPDSSEGFRRAVKCSELWR